MKPRNIIAIVNVKGGVGKTTTTVNLAACLAHAHRKRVLVLDMDPQANATRALLGDKVIPEGTSMRDVLVQDSAHIVGLRDIAKKTEISDLDLAPADLRLSDVEVKLVSRPGRESTLKKSLQTIMPSYDYILIDCPPSLGVLTLNALVAANGVIVPCETQFLSLRGLRYMLDVMKLTQARLNPELRLLGVLPTKFYILSSANNEALAYLRNLKGVSVYTAVIPRDVRCEEAPSHGRPLVLYAPEARATSQYLQLANEVIKQCQN